MEAEQCGCSLERPRGITTGERYLLLLLLVLTSEFLQQELSPLLEEIDGCHWRVRIDCSYGITLKGLLYACIPYL